MLILHIGRGKAGSSTLQNTLELNRAALQARGIAVPAHATEHRGHAVAVHLAMQRPDAADDALRELRALLDDPAHSHVFASSEFLFTATPAEIERLKQALGPHVPRIVVYLRDYSSWLRSFYGQGARRGGRVGDFDAFFDTAARRVSCRKSLTRWGEAFGWERLRVRHLAGLEGGIVGDLEGVVGCALAPGPDQNASPHWLETEFLRALYVRTAGGGTPLPQRAGVPAVLAILREAVDLHGTPDAEYLTLAQQRRLDDAYRADADWLARRADAPPPPPLPGRSRERPFLPALSAAPADVRETVTRRLRRSVRLKQHPELRAGVLSLVAEHWRTGDDGGERE